MADPDGLCGGQGPPPLGRDRSRRCFGARAGRTLTRPDMSAFGVQVALVKVSVDGTSLDMADTAANRAVFGAPPRNGKGATGPFPKIRLLTLIAGGTRSVGPFATGELTLLSKLVGLGVLLPGMLVLPTGTSPGIPRSRR